MLCAKRGGIWRANHPSDALVFGAKRVGIWRALYEGIWDLGSVDLGVWDLGIWDLGIWMAGWVSGWLGGACMGGWLEWSGVRGSWGGMGPGGWVLGVGGSLSGSCG